MTRFPFNDASFKNFGEIVNEILNEVPAQVNAFRPRTNISETKNSFEIEMLVPGRHKEDFKISLDKNLLTISYEPKEEKKDEERKTISKEFSFKAFSRSFSIDDKINQDQISGKYEDGVLILSLPKKDEVKIAPKEIAIA